MHGTHLHNAYEIVLITGTDAQTQAVSVTGVFVWANGYVTVYTDTDHNKGVVYPPWRVVLIRYGNQP